MAAEPLLCRAKRRRRSAARRAGADADAGAGAGTAGARHGGRAVQELPVLHQPPGRHRCRHMTIADGGYPGTGAVMPHRRRPDEELPTWKQEHNRSHKQVRASIEHAFARMKTWKILRDCRLKGEGVHHAVLGIAHLHNLARST
ncbi:transposase family protein [Streptomyces anulatus]